MLVDLDKGSAPLYLSWTIARSWVWVSSLSQKDGGACAADMYARRGVRFVYAFAVLSRISSLPLFHFSLPPPCPLKHQRVPTRPISPTATSAPAPISSLRRTRRRGRTRWDDGGICARDVGRGAGFRRGVKEEEGEGEGMGGAEVEEESEPRPHPCARSRSRTRGRSRRGVESRSSPDRCYDNGGRGHPKRGEVRAERCERGHHREGDGERGERGIAEQG
jgi:hypothetical protein